MTTTQSLGTFVLWFCVASGSGPWSYDGAQGSLTPPNWSKEYPVCGGGLNQSPIRLDNEGIFFAKFPNFAGYVTNKNSLLMDAELQNNGHTVAVNFRKKTHSVTGGGLPGVYNAAALHFHWGSDSARGSEHILGGRRYPLELHVVHYKSIYNNLDEARASNDSTALAVLGILFEIGQRRNEELVPVIQGIQAFAHKTPELGLSANVSSLAIGLLLDRVIDSAFYRYAGSLTTPGCKEQVVWTVFTDALSISEFQMQYFRRLLNDRNSPLVNNYRPTQKIGDRVVLISSSKWAMNKNKSGAHN